MYNGGGLVKGFHPLKPLIKVTLKEIAYIKITII